MRTTIETPIEASKLPPEIRREMSNITRETFVRISYEIVDENGFTAERQAELDAILDNIEHGRNLSPRFTTAEEAIACLRAEAERDDDGRV
jgi:hypothetical protein